MLARFSVTYKPGSVLPLQEAPAIYLDQLLPIGSSGHSDESLAGNLDVLASKGSISLQRTGFTSSRCHHQEL